MSLTVANQRNDHKLVIFDLDNTLSESRLPIDEDTADLLRDLLKTAKVAVISGGAFQEFRDRVIAKILDRGCFSNLYILPTTGAELYVWQGSDWRREYTYPFEKSKRAMVVRELSSVLGKSEGELAEFIEDRGTQLTYSALGPHAPVEDKKKWDPDLVKRREIIKKLTPRLSGIHMAIGGRTSIDFTEEGIDKAFGVDKLLDYLGLAPSDAVFVGDALVPGGNDDAVKSLGVKTILTMGPDETKRIIAHLLAPHNP